MRSVRLPDDVVEMLTTLLEALQATVNGEFEAKELPRWLPNGEEISTLGQLAAVLCTNEKTAACHVVWAQDPPEILVKQAKDVVGAPFMYRPGKPEIIERPYRRDMERMRQRRRRKKPVTEVKGGDE